MSFKFSPVRLARQHRLNLVDVLVALLNNMLEHWFTSRGAVLFIGQIL